MKTIKTIGKNRISHLRCGCVGVIRFNLLLRSEEREVLGIGSIPVAILPSRLSVYEKYYIIIARNPKTKCIIADHSNERQTTPTQE